MRISHETPIKYLELSKEYNDYDYALVHLFETHPEYFNFFKKSLQQGREVLLDNSIFELGVSFDPMKYKEWIQELKPTYYIVPDVLEDYKRTLRSAENWAKHHVKDVSYSEPIVVLQGTKYEHFKKQYQRYCELGYQYIAISFDYSYYTSRKEAHPHKIEAYMLGRVNLINRLYNDGIILKGIKHHLLGCSDPREFSYYKGEEYNFLTSLDTSSPVVLTIYNQTYTEDSLGRYVKPSTKLADLIEYNDLSIPLLFQNTRKFRKFVI